jgi:DNA (cytosine-5)-methyltransferase 1
MACDINENARKTYEANFAHISPDLFKNNNFYRDICELDYTTIPDFDIVCG